MTLHTEMRGDAWCIALDGELTIGTVAAVKDDLVAALADLGDCELDVSAVDEIDTAGLQLLLMARRSAVGVRRISGHSPALRRLIELANLGPALDAPPA